MRVCSATSQNPAMSVLCASIGCETLSSPLAATNSAIAALLLGYSKLGFIKFYLLKRSNYLLSTYYENLANQDNFHEIFSISVIQNCVLYNNTMASIAKAIEDVNNYLMFCM